MNPSISTHFSITDSKVLKLKLSATMIDVENIVRIISTEGRTGIRGDGIIYISDVENVYKVSTGLEDRIV
jgi:nitrogen regulatory protein P-II 1